MNFNEIINEVSELNKNGQYKEAEEKINKIDTDTISKVQLIQYYKFKSKLSSRFGRYNVLKRILNYIKNVVKIKIKYIISLKT